MKSSTISIISGNNELAQLLRQHDILTPEGFDVCFESHKDLRNFIAKKDDSCIGLILEEPEKCSDMQKQINELEESIFVISLNEPVILGDLYRSIAKHLSKYKGSNSLVEINNCTFSLDKSFIEISGDKINLTDKEAQIIDTLLKSKGEIMPKEQLLKKIWGYSSDIDTHTLETHIYRLRQKLGDNCNLITTEDGGYIINDKTT